MSPFQIVGYKQDLIHKFEKIMVVEDIGMEQYIPMDKKLIEAMANIPEKYAIIVSELEDIYISYIQITTCLQYYKSSEIVSRADILNIEYSYHAANELELLLWENMMNSFCIDDDKTIEESDKKAINKFRNRVLAVIGDVARNELEVKNRFSELLSF